MSDSPAPVAALVTVVVLLILHRLLELWISARHLVRLRERGAVEFGRAHFPGYVALHVLYPIVLMAEVLVGGARPPEFWPWLLLPLALAMALRFAAMQALGERWHVRVWVVPGEAPIRRGIYRWIAHPNYVAVGIELAVLPLIFGAWRTALGASLVNAVLVTARLRVERRALRWAGSANPGSVAPGGAVGGSAKP